MTTEAPRKKRNPGDKACWFIGNLTLTDDYINSPFVLRPWQADGIIRPLFGTLREDGLRQYKQCLIMLPRKQGKTELFAGVGVYCLLGEGKDGQEIICAASDAKQASKLFDKIVVMIRADPYLESQVVISEPKKFIKTKRGHNTLSVVTSEARRQLGGNPSVILFDELLSQRDRRLFDALTSGQQTRRERLLIMISTAGNSKQSLVGEQYDYACKVRDKVIDDPSFLPVIFEAPADADIWDEATWHKAMPALGDFADLDFMRDEFRKARHIPSEEAKCRQFYLGQWIAGGTKWVDSERWAECGKQTFAVAELAGRECYCGLDLSNTSDVTAFVLVFPWEDGTFRVFCHFWIAESQARRLDAAGRTNYAAWQREGFVEFCPGDTIDYDQVEAKVVELADLYDVRMVHIDRFNAGSVPTHLHHRHGIPCRLMGQGTFSMTAPIKFAEVMIAQGKLHHGGNPVLDWMAGNVVARLEGSDLIKFDKERSAEKIDGMVAMVMGLAGAMTAEPAAKPEITILRRRQ